MVGEPKVCPLTNKFCKSDVCMWWDKWTDRAGEINQACSVFHLLEVFEDVLQELKTIVR